MKHPASTHLDYTTVYGAARAVEPSEFSHGLPLSRLLSLSQFVEAIVLHENLTYELGTSELWRPYVEALQGSSLIGMLGAERWIRPLGKQVDDDDLITERAVKWAIEKMHTVESAPLFWAVQFRSGTYTGLIPTDESIAPFVRRYLDLAQSFDSATVGRFRNGLKVLNEREIGPVGFHVLVRVGLMIHALLETHEGSYAPHYSRQPVLISAEGNATGLREFSMDELIAVRRRLLRENRNDEDVLSLALSPVFLAALANASSPRGVIENALELRRSKAAQAYRAEVRRIGIVRTRDHSATELYKVRIRDRISHLNDFLFEKGVTDSYSRGWAARIGAGVSLGWMLGWRRTVKRFSEPGDASVVFFSDLMRQALGVSQSVDRIREIFGTPAGYDMTVISCASPDYQRRVAQQEHAADDAKRRR